MPQASAQAIMRPNLNVAPRIPTVNPTIAPRIDPNIAARTNTVTGIDRITPHVTPTTTAISRLRVNPNSTMPYARFSPNLHPACEAAYREGDGECKGTPVASGSSGSGKPAKGKGKGKGPNSPLATISLSFANELVAEIDGSMSEEQANALARRYGMVLVESQNLPLIEATIGLFRITDGRSLDAARRDFAAAPGVRNLQFNFRYLVQDTKPPTEGDPAQYAVSKLKLPQAHGLAHGMNVTIAVIDSGIDASHPELANSISDTFDALGSKEGAHVHGTGIAGASLVVKLPALDPHAVPLIGSPDAQYVVMLLFDYKCPHCQQLHFMLDEAIRRYDGKLAFALCPAPLNTQCNPYIPRDVDEFKGSCDLAKIGLAVWAANREAFPEFDRWMYSLDSGDRWSPRSLGAATAKAIELVGQAKFDAALSDRWIDQYLQTSIRIYGDTIQNDRHGNALPKLVFGRPAPSPIIPAGVGSFSAWRPRRL
jgi:protein-disulfide isomerase